MVRLSCRFGPGCLVMPFILAALLAGCSPRPFVVESPLALKEARSTLPKPEGPHDYDPRPRPLSLCYSSQLNSKEQVMVRARELCPNNGRLRYYDEDTLLNDCSLFQPNRVTFICTPGAPPPSPYD
jgi:hypothetical protein